MPQITNEQLRDLLKELYMLFNQTAPWSAYKKKHSQILEKTLSEYGTNDFQSLDYLRTILKSELHFRFINNNI